MRSYAVDRDWTPCHISLPPTEEWAHREFYNQTLQIDFLVTDRTLREDRMGYRRHCSSSQKMAKLKHRIHTKAKLKIERLHKKGSLVALKLRGCTRKVASSPGPGAWERGYKKWYYDKKHADPKVFIPPNCLCICVCVCVCVCMHGSLIDYKKNKKKTDTIGTQQCSAHSKQHLHEMAQHWSSVRLV